MHFCITKSTMKSNLEIDNIVQKWACSTLFFNTSWFVKFQRQSYADKRPSVITPKVNNVSTINYINYFFSRFVFNRNCPFYLEKKNDRYGKKIGSHNMAIFFYQVTLNAHKKNVLKENGGVADACCPLYIRSRCATV